MTPESKNYNKMREIIRKKLSGVKFPGFKDIKIFMSDLIIAFGTQKPLH